ncbi:glycosyltransferase, partial [Patescibacteria group bacterium]|nr:glycosyltransferase [Patescibacteria group bacterium]
YMITLSIIIPMYNEEARIGKCIRALTLFKPPAGVVIDRVIFADDGSYDHTIAKIKSQRSKIKYNLNNTDVQIISYEKNKGRGYALRTAMQEATGDYALWLDVDLSTPLSELKKIVPFMKRECPVIIGSRKMKGADVTVRQPLYRILLGQGFSKLSSIILDVPVGDFTCGFKAFSRIAYQTIFPLTTINGWGNDSETLYLAKKFNMRIIELPIHWENDPRTKVKVVRDIVVSFIDLCIIRLNDFLGVYAQRPVVSVVGEG